MANESQSFASLGLGLGSRLSKLNLISHRGIWFKLVHGTLAPDWSRISFVSAGCPWTNIPPQKRSFSYTESRRKFESIWSCILSVHLASNTQFYSPRLGSPYLATRRAFWASDLILVTPWWSTWAREIDLAEALEGQLDCGRYIPSPPWERGSLGSVRRLNQDVR